MKVFQLFMAVTVTVAMTGCQSQSVEAPLVHQCDRRAAAPTDGWFRPEEVKGVQHKYIYPRSAIRACEEAIASYPDVPRFRLYYARALHKAERYEEAANIYREFADQGHPGAMNNLGWLTEQGLGIERDIDAATELYRKAAQVGEMYGQYNLALMHMGRSDHPKDLQKAAKWMAKAAAQHYAPAQSRLAHFYENSILPDPNGLEARKWHMRAADQGWGYSLFRLGVMYAEGENGLQKNYSEAYRYLVIATQRKEKRARSYLARVEKHLTEDQIIEASNQAYSWTTEKRWPY